jgi:hypothetical protein
MGGKWKHGFRNENMNMKKQARISHSLEIKWEVVNLIEVLIIKRAWN